MGSIKPHKILFVIIILLEMLLVDVSLPFFNTDKPVDPLSKTILKENRTKIKMLCELMDDRTGPMNNLCIGRLINLIIGGFVC